MHKVLSRSQNFDLATLPFPLCRNILFPIVIQSFLACHYPTLSAYELQAVPFDKADDTDTGSIG